MTSNKEMKAQLPKELARANSHILKIEEEQRRLDRRCRGSEETLKRARERLEAAGREWFKRALARCRSNLIPELALECGSGTQVDFDSRTREFSCGSSQSRVLWIAEDSLILETRIPAFA